MHLCHMKSEIKHKLVLLSLLIQEVGTNGYHQPTTPEQTFSYREKFATGIHVRHGGHFARKSELEFSASTLCAHILLVV